MAETSEPNSYRAKLRSLAFVAQGGPPKVTTDVHDHHTVDVTEHRRHLGDDRVDVTVKPDTIRYRFGPVKDQEG